MSRSSSTARAQGLVCAECGEPPVPGGKRCATHRAAHNAREAERRAKLRRQRRCVTCGASVVRGRRYCQRHLDYWLERDRAKRAAG